MTRLLWFIKCQGGEYTAINTGDMCNVDLKLWIQPMLDLFI